MHKNISTISNILFNERKHLHGLAYENIRHISFNTGSIDDINEVFSEIPRCYPKDSAWPLAKELTLASTLDYHLFVLELVRFGFLDTQGTPATHIKGVGEHR